MIALKITCFLIGVVAIVAGCYSIARWIRISQWNSYDGTILRWEESFIHQAVVYFPVIAYQNDGMEVVFKSNFGSFPKSEVGGKVKVFVDPKTGSCRLFSLREVVLSILVPWIIGGVVILLGWHTTP